jgi:apolipoprotein N-acyltransferase
MWIAFIPLLYVVFNCGLKRAFLYGLLSGFVVNALSIYWLVAMLKFNTGSIITALFASCLLWAYLALYWGAWAFVLNIAKDRINSKWVLSAFAACLWIVLEYIRTYFLTGFPWLLIGYSQYKFPELIQIAEFCGVYGISFLIIFCNMLFYFWLKSRKDKKFILVAFALMIAISVFGAVRLDKFRFFGDKEYSAVIVQPSIDQDKKWNKKYAADILDSLNVYADEIEKKDTDLAIFPETALPFTFNSSSSSYSEAVNIVKKNGVFTVLSSIFIGDDGKFYNAVYSFQKDAVKYNAIHKKNHLVPFGEFVPLRKFLAKFIGMLNTFGDFEKGKDRQVFSNGKITLGALICSENFFPDISRDFVLNGAKVLTNHTNDAWFFDTAAPYQHFIMNVFRAIETRKAVLISANTGVSGIVEASGRIIAMGPVFETGLIHSNFLQNDFITFYTKRGDIFAALAAVFVGAILIIFLIANFKRRR